MHGGKKRDPFYGTEKWQRARQDALDRDGGCCVWCRAAGRTATDRHGRRVPVLAALVHHVEPLKARPDLALELDNLVSLCEACHDEAHPEKLAKTRKQKPPTAAQRLGVPFERL